MKFCIISILLFWASNSYPQNWTQTNGPNGGYIVKIIVDSADNYYAGTDQSGIFRSTNHGLSWEEFDQGLMNGIVIVQSMACVSDSEIFASDYWLSHQNCRLDIKTGIWKAIFPNSFNSAFISIFKTSKNTLLVSNGLLRRSDNDHYDTLFRSDSGIIRDEVISIVGGRNGELYAAANTSAGRNGSSVYRSLDDGNSWKSILDSIDGGTRLGALYVPQTSQLNNTVYIGTINFSGNWSGLLRTTNEGISWDTLLRYHSISDIVTVDNEIFVSVQNDGIYKSTDKGQSWKILNTGLTYFSDVQSLAVTKTKSILAATYGGGVYSLSLGDTIWYIISKGLPNTAVKCMAIEGSDTLYAGTTFSGVNVSFDKGNSWSQSSSGIKTATISSILITKNKKLYVGTEAGAYFSFDHANTWHKLRGINASINTIQLTDKGIIYICVTDSTFYLHDGDSVANRVNDLVKHTTINAITQTSDHNLYAFGTWEYEISHGYYGNLPGVLVSKGDGSSFENIFPPPPYYPQFFSGGLIGSLGNILYNIYGGLIQRSDNLSISWSSGISFRHDNTKGFMAGINNRLYVGTGYDGLLLSVDSGTTWSSLNEGLTNGTVNCIARDSSNFLYLGTENATERVKGGGVFRSISPGYTLGVQSSKVSRQNDQSKFILTSLNKTIRLQNDDVLSIKIFSLSGVEVGSFSNFIVDQDREINIYDLLKADGFYYFLISYRSGITNHICVIRA